MQPFFSGIDVGFVVDAPQASANTSPQSFPYDVTVTRNEREGFGFVIISSVTKSGSTIGEFIGTCRRDVVLLFPFLLNELVLNCRNLVALKLIKV